MSDMNKGKELYTPEELIWATQLAYCNFKDGDESDVDKTVQEIVSERGPEIFYDYDPDAHYSGDREAMVESTESFLEDVANGNKCKDWKIVSVYDHEEEEGIYAVMIDTGNGNAIVAYRGSESVWGQIVKDWGQADLQIANGTMTKQEYAACRYLDEIANDKEFDMYQDIAVTGHSLGGDLAHVATIYTATDEQYEPYQKVNAEYWKLKKAEEKNGKPLGFFRKSQAEEYKRKHQTELNTYKIYRDTLKSMIVEPDKKINPKAWMKDLMV